MAFQWVYITLAVDKMNGHLLTQHIMDAYQRQHGTSYRRRSFKYSTVAIRQNISVIKVSEHTRSNAFKRRLGFSFLVIT